MKFSNIFTRKLPQKQEKARRIVYKIGLEVVYFENSRKKTIKYILPSVYNLENHDKEMEKILMIFNDVYNQTVSPSEEFLKIKNILILRKSEFISISIIEESSYEDN